MIAKAYRLTWASNILAIRESQSDVNSKTMKRNPNEIIWETSKYLHFSQQKIRLNEAKHGELKASDNINLFQSNCMKKDAHDDRNLQVFKCIYSFAVYWSFTIKRQQQQQVAMLTRLCIYVDMSLEIVKRTASAGEMNSQLHFKRGD